MAENYCSANELNELLLLAAQNGSPEFVEAALEAGADIDVQFEQMKIMSAEIPTNGTALFTACINGHVDIVRLLLRKGASVTKRVCSLTPLHAAATDGNTELVELLVQHGATLDVRDGYQNTPLMHACGNKHVDTVRRLIELGARPDLTDGYIARRLRIGVENLDSGDESMKLIQEARKTKLLRCCNPKCGKPGHRSALKRCGHCKLTRYCGRDCQAQHWLVGHKKCCGHDACSTGEGVRPIQNLVKLMTNHTLLN